MKKILSLLVMLFSFQHLSFSQVQPLVDSLESQLKNYNTTKKELQISTPSLSDTTPANILYQLSRAYWGNNPDKAMDNANQSLAISEQIGYKKGMAKAYYSMGIIHSDWGEYAEALLLQEKSLKIYELINNKSGIADSYNEMGLCYYYMGNNSEALKNYFVSIKINEELGNKKAAAGTYMNIGNVYTNTLSYDEALKNHLLSLKAFKEIGFKRGIAMACNNIGTVYSLQGKLAEALSSYEESKKIKEEMGDRKGIANVLVNIGAIHTEEGNFSEALKVYTASVHLQEELGDKYGLCNSFLGMGKMYEKQGQHKDAIAMTQKGLALAVETGNKNAISDGYSALASIYAKLQNFKPAYENQVLFKQAYDSVFNAESDRKLTQQAMQFDFDKKVQSDSLKFAKEKEITEVKLQKQKVLTYGGFGGVAITIVLLFFLYRNYNKQRIANQKLKEAQEQLIQSEKMAAFGIMASRVSHEILNPLNFVNNFSNLSQEVVIDVIKATNEEDKKQQADLLIYNLQKINEHGNRAAGIVRQLQEDSNKGNAQGFFETTQL